MSSHRTGETDEAIAQAAAEWVARRDRGLTHEEHRAFSQWAADPRHAAELERVGSAWRGLDQIGAVSELEAMADDFLERARARRAKRRVLRFSAVSLAAAAVAVLGVFTWKDLSQEAPSGAGTPTGNYRVLASTSHQMVLPDGSVAELNGASRIEVSYTPTERHVRLIDGEAHFSVAKNPDRPFFVTAGSVTVRAVGTAFNVRLASAAIEVLVTEGKVALATDAAKAKDEGPETKDVPGNELIAGQRAVIDRPEAEGAPANVAIDAPGKSAFDEALGWQTTRLEFNNTPLSEVVEAFNHYNQHKLTIGDPALRSRALTGVFRADNREGFVRLLRASVDVKAEQRTPTETVLLPMR